MAKTTVVTITDDIDGSTDDVVTCAFGLGDAQFEIDLNAEHREELENFLARFIEYARSVPGSKAAGRQGKPARKAVDRDRTAEVRSWAKTEGLGVSERGRISRAIIEAFDAAH
jgi:hypothetical protein